MRIAALQFDVRRGDVAHNLEIATDGLRRAAREQAGLVVLPEMWPSSFPGPEADLEHQTRESERAVGALAKVAAELGVMFGGSSFGAPESNDCDKSDGKPANRWQLFDGERCLASYDKVHLFSPTAEHESFSAGCEPPPVAETRLGRIGGLVCYDLRFPQLARTLFDQGAQLVCLSAQWPVTRAAHFRALAIALAVTNQCFVVAANRCGTEAVGRRALVLEFPGNSLIVDPHGSVLAEGDGQEGLVAAEVDLALANEMRLRVPVAKDQRRELYAAWEARNATALVSGDF
jgi:predicted amidohydrolase